MNNNALRFIMIVLFGVILANQVGCGARITTPIVTSQKKADKDSIDAGVKKKVKEPVVIKKPAQQAENQANKGSVQTNVKGKDYRIGPGDVLHISVWNNEELTLDVMVRPDGKISLPLIQDVTTAGLTAEELRSIIEVRLKEYLIEPVVTATVKEVNYPKFYIMGEISKPGTYPLREQLTVLQAISLAGGFTQFASPRNIRLIRNNSMSKDNIKINYYDLIKFGNQDKNLFLIPGDTLIIP